MRGHTKKHPTDVVANVTWHGSSYAVPVNVIEKYKIDSDSEFVAIKDIFSPLIHERGEPGLLLKGLRHREGLTQIVFAKTIAVTQANLSAMENGRRSIGKDIAKRIEKKFGVSYKLFLG